MRLEEAAGRPLLLYLGANDPAIDVKLAAMHRRSNWQQERVSAVDGLGLVLVVDLVEFDVGDAAYDLETAFNSLQRKHDTGLFEPGNKAKTALGWVTGIHGRRESIEGRTRVAGLTVLKAGGQLRNADEK